jgi:hypothetical protein
MKGLINRIGSNKEAALLVLVFILLFAAMVFLSKAEW